MQRLQPLVRGRFSTSSQSWNIWCLLEPFFTQNQSNVNTESILSSFREFKNFWPKLSILQRLYPMQRLQPLQDGRFSTSSQFWNIWYFCTELLQCEYKKDFDMFQEFQFLAQIKYFAKSIEHAKAITFARWPIFNIVSFLEYLVLFRAVYCTEFL